MKVVDMPQRQSETRAAIERLRREIGDALEAAVLVAKIRRAHYLAYIAEGFTEAQALELCKVL